MAFLVYFLAPTGGLFILLQRKKFTDTFQWLGIYMLFMGVVMAFAKILTWTIQNNIVLYRISIPIEYIIVFFLFRSLVKGKNGRRLLSIFFILILAVLIFMLVGNFVVLGVLGDLILIAHIGVVAWCLIYYYSILQKPGLVPLTRQADFWMVSGLFFYFLVSFAYWTLQLLEYSIGPEVFAYLHTINEALTLIFYIILWISILVHLREAKTNAD